MKPNNLSPEQVIERKDELPALSKKHSQDEPRFFAASAREMENLLAAIELCEVGFGSGSKLTEDLNRLLRDEWPTNTSSRRES